MIKIRVPANCIMPWIPNSVSQANRDAIQAWMNSNPRNFGNQQVVVGRRNPVFEDLFVYPAAFGKWEINKGVATCEIEDGIIGRDVERLIFAIGGTVSGRKMFIEITDPDLPIPVGLPGGNGTRTWQRLIDHFDTHPVRQVGGKWYVGAYRNRRGDPLDMDIIEAVNDPNLRFIELDEMKQILIDNNPEQVV